MGNVNTFLYLYTRAYEYRAQRRQEGVVAYLLARDIWNRADAEWNRLTLAQRREAIRRNPSITWRYNV